ncbi:FliM/FliN family flagellar motor C-terminal domain-containing protein [Roseovarius aestuarii]|nr:FliM/FliN family flagellar motor C-terminal domain-containing protein [Roseovarius aestuarii]
MSDGKGNTVIHRKARVAREEYQARAMSTAKALRLSLATSADQLFDLALVVTALEQVELSQTAVRTELDGGGLLMLLDGPAGVCGGVRVDLSLLNALIEVQTTGRVTGRVPADRPVTRTDAAIVSPLIDAALAGAEALLKEETPDHWASGFRFGVMMEDARSMTLALHAPAFHVFRLYVEAGDVGQTGAICVLLPVPAKAPQSDPQQDVETLYTLEHSAMDAPVSLEAVLGRIRLPLSQVCAFEVGEVLPFSMDRPMEARLEASQKHKVAVGRLGQVNGARAVRLSSEGHTPAEVSTDQDVALRRGLSSTWLDGEAAEGAKTVKHERNVKDAVAQSAPVDARNSMDMTETSPKPTIQGGKQTGPRPDQQNSELSVDATGLADQLSYQ